MVMAGWFYLLRLKSGTLYAGATTDIHRRYQEHRDGKAGRTTREDPPIALVHCEQFSDFAKARKREAQVKRWSRAKKQALAAGNLSQLRTLASSRRKP